MLFASVLDFSELPLWPKLSLFNESPLEPLLPREASHQMRSATTITTTSIRMIVFHVLPEISMYRYFIKTIMYAVYTS